MYKLTETLPFMMYTIGNHLAQAFSAELSERDLSLSMYRVLAALLEREDQRLSDLSDMIHVEISTLSRLIGAMKKRGLVSRRRQQNDERSVRINLTPEGRKLVDTLIPRAQYYENLAVRTLKRSDVAALKISLSSIVEDLSATKPASTALVESVSAGSPRKGGRSAK